MGLLDRLGLVLAFLILRCLCRNENSCETIDRKCVRVAALIPARSGSKGIKNKNLAFLGNETLISRTVRIVQNTGNFDSVWVLTDGEAIAVEARKQKAEIYWRDPLSATDTASTVSAVEDFLRNRNEYDVIAVVQCTSPFLQKSFLQNALNIMLNSDVDCLFSVVRSFQLRWKEQKDGLVSPLNFSPNKRPRRQDWKGELVENGMFYFVKPTLVLQDKVLQNDRCKVIEIPKQFSLEIDTETDLLIARTLLPLLNHPEEMYNKYNKMSMALEKRMAKADLLLKKALEIFNALHLKKFCCLFSLRQGTIMIAVTELVLTSFSLFLLLLGATHAQDMVTLVTSDLHQLEESEGRVEESSNYIINNEKKMLVGQHLAFIIMFVVWAGLLLTSIHFISCVLLLYGAIRNSPNFLLPWTLTALFSLISGSFFLIMLAFVPLQCKFGVYALLVSCYATGIYIWIIVFSYYNELKT